MLLKGSGVLEPIERGDTALLRLLRDCGDMLASCRLTSLLLFLYQTKVNSTVSMSVSGFNES